MKEINAFNLIGKLIAIHNNMPNDYLNGLIGESIDCIEKQNQKITCHKADNKTLKSDLLEMSKHISNRYETYEGGYSECTHCLQGGWSYKHKNDCPVLKAEEIIRNNKE